MPDPLPRLALLIVALSAAGCGTEPPAAAHAGEPGPPSLFDPAKCGRIEGTVAWAAPLPTVHTFLYGVPKPDGSFDSFMMANPNRPDIDPDCGAVAGAVVFLRGVDRVASKPWNLPPARVEMAGRNIVVRQGEEPPRRVGFVRRGDAVTLGVTDPFFHAVRGRGATFFTYTFPDPGTPPRRRTFDTAGRVELTSAAGFYWASADLFVDDHPYYTVTDHDGHFALTDVPAGRMELVVWLPNWDFTNLDRDPESGLISRLTYGPPRERITPVTVPAGGSRHVPVELP